MNTLDKEIDNIEKNLEVIKIKKQFTQNAQIK